MASEIIIPRTHQQLVIADGTEMYLRGLQVFVGTPTMQMHHCEQRYLPLFTGTPEQSMDEVNTLRSWEMIAYVIKCEKAAKTENEQIVFLSVHLAPGRQDWHTMYEVQVALTGEAGIAKLVIPKPDRPKIQLEKSLSLVFV